MFYSPYFTYNGIHCLDKGVRIVSFDSNVLNDFGLGYKEELVVGESNKIVFYHKKNTVPDPITLSLALVNKNEEPIAWDFKSIGEVTRWLLQPYFCEFTTEDIPELVYYFKCIEIKKRLNSNKQGVLEVTFQPETSYGLTSILHFAHICHDTLNVSIDNVSNIGENYLPKIEVIQHDQNKKDIVIENLGVSKTPLVISNLEYGEKLTIDNYMKTIESSIGKNRFADVNRSWIELKYGVNKFLITGDCQINIVCQFPIIV